MGGKEQESPGEPWEPRVSAGAFLSSEAIGGAVAGRGPRVCGAPLSGRGGELAEGPAAGLLRPPLWPGLPQRLTDRSVRHHGEAGQ